MKKRPFNVTDESIRSRLLQAIKDMPLGFMCIIQDITRTLEQNAKMWPMLGDLASQVIWHGVKLSDEEWKDFATATLKQQKFVPNLDGSGFIAVGGRTSTMGKKKFADLIEIIYMIGAQNDVVWSEAANKVFQEHGHA